LGRAREWDGEWGLSGAWMGPRIGRRMTKGVPARMGVGSEVE
jgi:hypothetical protein